MSRFNPSTGDLILQLANGTFKDYSESCFGQGPNHYEYEEEDDWVLTIKFDDNKNIIEIKMTRGMISYDLGIDLATIQVVLD